MEQTERKTGLNEDDIQRIILGVVSKQVRDQIRPQERDDLVNEAWLAVLELKNREQLSEPLLRTIIKRRLIQYKIQQSSALSIPLNSAWWWGYKQGRMKVGMELKDSLITNQEGWKERERQNDLKLTVKKARQRLGYVERMVLDQLLEGGQISEVWRELERRGFRLPKKLAYQTAPARIREALQEVKA